MIRLATEEDVEAVCSIYNHYIEETIVPFEEEPVSNKQMRERIRGINEQWFWFVFEEGDRIIGYAYAGPWNSRAAYRHSVEVSVYLDPETTGKGIGTALYQHIIDQLKKRDVHTIIGGVSLPNKASVALHEKLGFHKAAHYAEVGRKFDQWIDVGYWQLNL